MSGGDAQSAARVVIAGGGIAGLEAVLALREFGGERVQMTLICPEPDFTYKPMTVDEPFSGEPAERHELAPIAAELGAEFVQRGIERVEPEQHLVRLDDGAELPYDALVVCVGARARPAYEHAITFKSSGEELRLSELLTEAKEGQPDRIAFVVPPGNTWPLPLYELALMTKRRGHDQGLEQLECRVITPEASPLIVFGVEPSSKVAELLEARRISVTTGARVSEDSSGTLTAVPGGEEITASHVVALPVLEGPSIAGLPADDQGFMPIDSNARVKGVEDVYAAGDGTNFPIKQGGLGTQQADAAAAHIAARFGAEIDPQPFQPVLRGMLLAGDESLSLRHGLTGGSGEGKASLDYLWWPPHKVSGRFLAPWLAHEIPHADPEPPVRPLEVEVALPTEWHEDPMALDPYSAPEVD